MSIHYHIGPDDFQRKGSYYFGMLYDSIKPLLFSLPAESVHDLAIKTASLSPALGKLTGIHPDPKFSVRVGSNRWSFPIGLAAGLDKNAEALPFFENQGFGAIECGTITLRGQLGNDKPRLFRYPDEESLRNSMGFPNHGLEEIWPRLHRFERKSPLGANIGKNKESTPEESIEELVLLSEALSSFVDYFVINVSSPNTPGLRAFQDPSYLRDLFTALKESGLEKDLYLKIAPDLEKEKVEELIKVSSDHKLTGLIATNTTIMPERGLGGVSGKLLSEKAKRIRTIILEADSPLELIGVGGVSDIDDLKEFWRDGGKVMQVYSSYIFQGPKLLWDFKCEISKLLDKENLSLESFLALSRTERRKLL